MGWVIPREEVRKLQQGLLSDLERRVVALELGNHEEVSMKRIELSNCALVEYCREESSVQVTIDGYWFTRKTWDELTAELFSLSPVDEELGHFVDQEIGE